MPVDPKDIATIAAQDVALDLATSADALLLSNLLELYIHDLSEIFSIDIGAEGRFGYEKLPLYWSEPERRSAFLIRFGGRIVGFALVTRGSPATDDRNDLDVAEFFVLRRHRRAGVGRHAAALLWNRVPGSWVVRVSQGNRSGLAFWDAVIRDYTGGAFTRGTRPGTPHAWCVYSFTSPPPGTAV